MDGRSILVTGGAGYIGSHAVLALLDQGRRVVIIDNLSTGNRILVPEAATLVVGDIADAALVGTVLRDHNVGAVMHFAGSVVVPESVTDPLKYYRNNTVNSRTLLECCVAAGVGRFIFSSTAAVYGEAQEARVSEAAACRPISPYGTSKWMTEMMLADVAAAHDFRYVALRYFNVAGADPAGRSGQATPGATHLIKVACERATGKRADFAIYGSDYNTPDGTCVRDYIHVSDLADAHVRALSYLEHGGGSAVLNCGYGCGYTVRQVVASVEKAAGYPLGAVDAPRRLGDAEALVADSAELRRLLGWTPRHDDLDLIVRNALAWERRLSQMAL